jgi:putative zinc finger/helix-turn-helix YgiT family protein
MKSPFTGKEMKLIKEKMALPYRKDQFEILYHTFECVDTNERFTNDELDLINTNQVYNSYREKYGIPFSEEIQAIREKYEVSAKKMSEILGFGSNAYRLYESGEIPSVSNGRLIASIKEPEEFRRQIKFSSHLLKENEMTKLLKIVDHLIQESWSSWRKSNQNLEVSEVNGFKMFNLEKVAYALDYLKTLGLFKTKVNKFLFYLDFLSFQKQGSSMFGLTYKAITHGPVPINYEELYDQLYFNNFIDLQELPTHEFIQKIVPKIEFDGNLFNEAELEILNKVVSRFENLNTQEVVNISHDEDAWLDNHTNRNLISYKKYAFDLKAFQ